MVEDRDYQSLLCFGHRGKEVSDGIGKKGK